MMDYDYLIIGQGICGTWLSYYLLNEGKSVFVIDEFNSTSASNIASGLINPVTGRRVVTTWMADELMPFVLNEYNAIGSKLNTTVIQQKNILAFPSAPDLLQAFIKRKEEQNSYIVPSFILKEKLFEHFYFPFDAFKISPCYLVDINFLQDWRNYLQNINCLSNEKFNEEALEFTDDIVEYKTIKAKKIIYCNGLKSAQSKYWKNLPFVSNKGQALIAEINSIDRNYIYKFGHLSLIPIQNNLWWIGASNELNFETAEPTNDFFQSTKAALKRILKVDFKIADHVASVRPAAVERRPFVGIHPSYNQVVILNGMGSKGYSLAPWFAKELAQHLIYQKPINALADVKRYTNVLSRSTVNH